MKLALVAAAAAGSARGSGGVTLTQVDAGHASYVFHGGGVVSRGVLTRAKRRR